jgi:hypothetical protein
MRRTPHAAGARAQRGTVVIIAALSLTMLVGFAGLALDLGRLYLNKTELQSAADACALAAARELVCDPSVGTCPTSYLTRAEAAGIFVGGRNSKDFQGQAVAIAPEDVRFSTSLSPNSNYAPRTMADPNSKFAMCIARATGVTPWFMGVLGIGDQAVSAYAVATLAPSQTVCNGLPVGICTKPGSGAPDFGYTVGEWVESNFTPASNNDDVLTGDFVWVDFTPSGGGNAELREQIAGRSPVCGIRVGDDVSRPGQQQGAKSAWNTRFGIYPPGANAPTPQDTPPDRTGYSYPNRSPGSPVISIGMSAYADYRQRQAQHTPFTSSQYAPSGAAGNFSGSAISAGAHQSYGAERRLTSAAIIDCNAGNTVPLLGFACVLMLNPMSNGATGKIYLEYRGQATAANSPCFSAGVPGGAGSGAGLVPTLVQ